MKTLEEIALEISHEMQLGTELIMGDYNYGVTEFSRRLLAKLAEGIEPVAIRLSNGIIDPEYGCEIPMGAKLYPASAIAAIQQQTAEACAKLCDFELNNPVELLEVAKTQTECAAQIRSGAWRKYLKDHSK